MRFLHSLSIVSICAALASPACTTIGHDDGPGLLDVASGDGRLVAVGSAHGAHGAPSEAFIVTSADGSSWTEVATDVKVPLSAVAFGAGRFVAVGGERLYDDSGEVTRHAVLSSTDGRTWKHAAAAPAEMLDRIVFGANRFVAVSEHGDIFTSTDGDVWAEGPKAIIGSSCGVVFGGGRFVGCGADSALMISPDGLSWMGVDPPVDTPVVSVAFANGELFVGLADVCDEAPCEGPYGLMRSRDGLSWDGPVQVDAYPVAAAFSAGTYLASTSDGLLRSRDGESWSAVNGPDGNPLSAHAITGPKGFVAIGQGTILTSADGATWSTAFTF